MGTWNLSPTFVTLRALGVPKRGAFWSVVSPVLQREAAFPSQVPSVPQPRRSTGALSSPAPMRSLPSP